MEEVSHEVAVKGNRWWRWFAVLVLFVFLFAFFGWLMLGYGGMLEAPLRLAVGWVFHGAAMLPPLLPRWMGLLMPLACLALALGFLHRFVRWWLAAKGAATVWNPKQTLAAGLLLLLGAAAAIAMSGIIHQAAWLGGETWFENRGKYFNHRRDATQQAYEIAKALERFKAREGGYPESLAELDLPSRLLFVRPSAYGLPEPFTYLKPAAEPATRWELPLLISPVLPHDDTILVQFSSGETRSIPLADLPRLLDARKPAPAIEHE